MINLLIAGPAVDSIYTSRMTLKATVIENYSRMIVSPTKAEDKATLGNRVELNPSCVEDFDSEGNTIHFTELKNGDIITITYDAFYEWPEYTQLNDGYSII